MIRGRLFDVRRYSIHDGPGIRTTVFFQGCPLSCAWCHNPESQSFTPFVHVDLDRCSHCASCVHTCPEKALTMTEKGPEANHARCHASGVCAEVCPSLAIDLVGREWSVEEVVAEVAKDECFYEESGGGVTFSGGEPLAQPEFLLALLQACGARGWHRAVDTSGFADGEVLARVAAETDLFLFDLKTIDGTRHRELTGVSNEPILANLRRLTDTGVALQIRRPLIGGINDDDAELEETIDLLSELVTRPDIALLPYHASARDKHERFALPWRMEGDGEVSEQRVQAIAARFEARGFRVAVGGGTK